METWKAMLMALGRIEGELVEIRKLNERVRRLEIWAAAAIAALYFLPRI